MKKTATALMVVLALGALTACDDDDEKPGGGGGDSTSGESRFKVVDVPSVWHDKKAHIIDSETGKVHGKATFDYFVIVSGLSAVFLVSLFGRREPEIRVG